MPPEFIVRTIGATIQRYASGEGLVTNELGQEV